LDSFPTELSYGLHLPIGFNAVEVDHGWWLSAMGGMSKTSTARSRTSAWRAGV